VEKVLQVSPLAALSHHRLPTILQFSLKYEALMTSTDSCWVTAGTGEEGISGVSPLMETVTGKSLSQETVTRSQLRQSTVDRS